MRWPSRRAQTARPERWRMRRWSKEPRRMSLVEGREVASLARALSVCFIYQYETINRGPCQEFFKHFYEILLLSILAPDCPPTEPVRDGTMTLAYPPVARQSGKSEGRFFPL